MQTSALTRIRRRNAREPLATALTLTTEGLRLAVKRDNSTRTRDQLRRSLCTIAERLGVSDVELEPLIAQVRCGHHRGRWTRECALNTTPAKKRRR